MFLQFFLGMILLSSQAIGSIEIDFATIESLATAFDDSKFTQDRVRIRGFLYMADDGKLILAAEPNLKSCCVGNKSLKKQLWIEGRVDPTGVVGMAILLEGKLALLDERLHLMDATIIEESKGKALIWLGGVIVFLTCCVWSAKRFGRVRVK